MRNVRIQSLVASAGVAFALLAIVAVGALMWLSSQLHDAAEVIDRNAATLAVVEDVELALLDRSRVANLAWATGDEAAARRRDALDDKLDAAFADVRGLVPADTRAARLLADAEDARGRYVARRAEAEREAATLQTIVTAARDDFDATMNALRALRHNEESELSSARAYASMLDRFAQGVGTAVFVAVLVAFVVLLVGVRRHVIRPLIGLSDAVSGWRPGGPREEVPERGPREIVRIARAFNDLSAELARQREAQLTFLAGVAHDLRNPLNGLAMAGYTLRDDVSEGVMPNPRLLELIEREVHHLDRMIGDLLDLTRIEAGRLELAVEEVDLRDVVEAVEALYAPTAADHPIVLELPETPVRARADPLRVEQIVGNLVSNAIKYSPHGRPVRIRLSASGTEAWIDVEDQGDGIPEADRASIFEPYRRRRQTRDSVPGAGLGLSTVRRLVEAHCGVIEVLSGANGRGALFRVKLPLAGAPPVDRAGTQAKPDLRPRGLLAAS